MISKQKLEKNLEEKFYYGYDNREEILESIIYFANHELHQEKAKDKNYSLRQEYTTSKEPFWKENVKRATQLYTQFYRFVDLNDIPSPRRNNPFNYFSYDIGMTQEEMQEQVEERMLEMVKTKKIYIYPAGIYIAREKEEKATIFHQDDYALLCQLEELEKTDKLEYYDKWITTKWQRALHADKKDDEFEIINKVYEAFQERKRQIMQHIKKDDAR